MLLLPLQKKEPKKQESVKTEKKAPKEKTKKDKQPGTNGELWDDGMKVPDWLKTDEEK